MPAAPRRLLIGALADQAGLSRDTLRSYEKLGLLRPGGRTAGGYRWYPPDAIQRIRVIQGALAIGFSLSELASLFRERAAGEAPCKRARALAGEKLDALSAKLLDLLRLRDQLEAIIATWDERLAQAGPFAPAHLLDGLAEPAAAPEGGGRPPAGPTSPWGRVA